MPTRSTEHRRQRRLALLPASPARCRAAARPGCAEPAPGPTAPRCSPSATSHVAYGGVVAVDGVSFEVPAGSIVGVIGPNGAGKTTLMDAICGFAAYEGSVVLDGSALDGLPPHRRARRGLARTFQGVDLYDDLTVEENVMVGQYTTGGRHAPSSTRSSGR